MALERYSLPGKHFVESFRGLPRKTSSVALSIHTHNEQLRRRNGLFRYSNRDLEDSLALMESVGIRSQLFFACGLPFETRQDLEDMFVYQQTLRKRFKSLGMRTAMIEIEPGSLMSRDPKSWNIRLERSSFAEYYHYHGQAGRNHYQEMGYLRRGLPARQEVTDYFCRHFCEKIHAGRLSPYVCDTVEGLRKLGAFRIVDKVLSFRDKP